MMSQTILTYIWHHMTWYVISYVTYPLSHIWRHRHITCLWCHIPWPMMSQTIFGLPMMSYDMVCDVIGRRTHLVTSDVIDISVIVQLAKCRPPLPLCRYDITYHVICHHSTWYVMSHGMYPLRHMWCHIHFCHYNMPMTSYTMNYDIISWYDMMSYMASYTNISHLHLYSLWLHLPLTTSLLGFCAF